MSDRFHASRRGVLTATAAALAVPAVVGARSATEADTQTETFRLASDLDGWRGVAPAAIEGEMNPTLSLTPGEEYEIVWENADGVSHNLYVEDGSGDAVASTETVGEEGATRSVTFTATEAVATYRCRIHGSMTGDVQVGSETTTTTTEDGGTDTTQASDTTGVDGGTTTTDTAETTADGGDDGTDATDGDGGAGDDGSDGSGDGDDREDGGDGSSDSGGQPGFGVAAAVAGLAGALGLRRRRR
ncbi:cupredoxin domain-containing protein [Halostella salina]|uniref:cupredoxin domain-containing protein n=1 Tax=Halostella salina TaxID=1547897 RepID=UPI000EF82049|nr:PGF-CTERM sorting domain-containing protein [Halostella salina]